MTIPLKNRINFVKSIVSCCHFLKKTQVGTTRNQYQMLLKIIFPIEQISTHFYLQTLEIRITDNGIFILLTYHDIL